jgi:thiamine biosynthesis protein ThiI
MDRLYLIKYGELSLKGKNRQNFENRVRDDIRLKLSDLPIKLRKEWGRLYLYPPSPERAPDASGRIESTLARTFGIVGFSKSYAVAKNIDEIQEAACAVAEGLLRSRGKRFKIEARRSDKSYPHSSYDICCILGDSLRSRYPELKVDLNRPDWIIQVEVRKRVYV